MAEGIAGTLLTEDEIIADLERDFLDIPTRHGEWDPARWLNEVAYREALHASWIFHQNVNEYLVQHPCVISDPEAYRWARLAGECLFLLYQRLGALGHNLTKAEVSTDP